MKASNGFSSTSTSFNMSSSIIKEESTVKKFSMSKIRQANNESVILAQRPLSQGIKEKLVRDSSQSKHKPMTIIPMNKIKKMNTFKT